MYVMLSLDLEKNVSTEKRDKFYEFMKNEKWVKIDKVTTTWYASFTEISTEQSAMQITKSDVANAAKHSGISSYFAVANCSASKPISF